MRSPHSALRRYPVTPAVRLNLPLTPCFAGTLMVACALARPASLDVAVELFVSEPARSVRVDPRAQRERQRAGEVADRPAGLAVVHRGRARARRRSCSSGACRRRRRCARCRPWPSRSAGTSRPSRRATIFASARFLSTMCGLGDGAAAWPGSTGAARRRPGGGGRRSGRRRPAAAAGGATGGATGGGDGRRRRRAGAGHTSVTVGIEPPLQVAPTVSVPKMGQVCVTAVCAGTVNCWVTPFTVSVETLVPAEVGVVAEHDAGAVARHGAGVRRGHAWDSERDTARRSVLRRGE